MLKVLVVDDSKVMQKLVAACVKDLGADVVAVGNDGEEGVELFKEFKPDLVLLDITMPNKDGSECLVDILKIEPHANVVILSALNSEKTIKEMLALGAKAFVDKSNAAQRSVWQEELSRFIKPKVA